jgi:hypothetical protein
MADRLAVYQDDDFISFDNPGPFVEVREVISREVG